MRNPVFLRRCFLCLGLFLLPAPVFLLAGAGAGIGAKLLLPLLTALLLGLGVRRARTRYRLLCVAVSMGLCFALSRLLCLHAVNAAWAWAGAALAALAAALYPRFMGQVFSNGMDSAILYAGLAADGGVSLVCALIPLPEAGAMLRLFTWVYCVYMAFALTFESLWTGVGYGRSPSRAMILKNAAVALGWAGLFLLLTHIPEVMRALRACVEAVVLAAVWLVSLLARLGPSGTGGNGGGSGDFGALAGESAEPSWLALFLEKVMYAVALVLLTVVAFFVLRALAKTLRRAFRALAAWFRTYANAVSDSDRDQVESLLDWGEVRRGLRERRQARRQARADRIPWERLSPRDQVRRSYRDFLARHPDIPDQSTARQALPDPRQADIYEAARYSTRDITPEEAREAKAMIKSL